MGEEFLEGVGFPKEVTQFVRGHVQVVLVFICHTSVIQLETDTKVKKATVCLLLTKPNNQLTSRPSVTLCSKNPLTMIVCLRRVRGLLSARLVKIQNKAGVDNYPGRPDDQRGGGRF